jgi:hypothetical protein
MYGKYPDNAANQPDRTRGRTRRPAKDWPRALEKYDRHHPKGLPRDPTTGQGGINCTASLSRRHRRPSQLPFSEGMREDTSRARSRDRRQITSRHVRPLNQTQSSSFGMGIDPPPSLSGCLWRNEIRQRLVAVRPATNHASSRRLKSPVGMDSIPPCGPIGVGGNGVAGGGRVEAGGAESTCMVRRDQIREFAGGVEGGFHETGPDRRPQQAGLDENGTSWAMARPGHGRYSSDDCGDKRPPDAAFACLKLKDVTGAGVWDSWRRAPQPAQWSGEDVGPWRLPPNACSWSHWTVEFGSSSTRNALESQVEVMPSRDGESSGRQASPQRLNALFEPRNSSLSGIQCEIAYYLSI